MNTGAETTIWRDEAALTTEVTTRVPGATEPVRAATTTTDRLGRPVAIRESHREGTSATLLSI